MNHFRNCCFFLIAFLLASANITAQPQIGCNDRAMRLQAEQFKVDMKPQGFTTYRDAMLTMESKEPYPIAVQLTKGKTYQMLFIGTKQASNINFELMDGEDKKIDSRAQSNVQEINNIVYTFTPEKSDVYLIVLTQKFKGKNLCGSFTILEKGNSSEPTGK